MTYCAGKVLSKKRHGLEHFVTTHFNPLKKTTNDKRTVGSANTIVQLLGLVTEKQQMPTSNYNTGRALILLQLRAAG